MAGCTRCNSGRRAINSAAQPQQKGAWLWSKNPLAYLLWPFSLVFCLLVFLRYQLYQWHWLKSWRIGKPVIVVGNISIGGNGKTPVVHSLVKLLRAEGYHPGILTRGYKSDYEGQAIVLTPGEITERAGDEANMLSELCACPMGVGADRVRTGKKLLENFPQIDVVIADDGLQHYSLARDVEIIVRRQQAMGNGFCLPAGPLREPEKRLLQCDMVVDRDSGDTVEKFADCWNLVQPEITRAVTTFRGQPVNAIAGIGFPEIFFNALREQGLDVQSRAFADHHEFSPDDLAFNNTLPLLVTHKDAVKIRPFATDNIWVVPLELTLSNDLQYRFLKIVESKIHG